MSYGCNVDQMCLVFRNLTLVDINQPVVKLVWLYVILPQFQEPIDDVKRGFTIPGIIQEWG